MKFYFFPVAPNPTKVRLYLAEKENLGTVIPVEPQVVNLVEGEQKSPEHLARNPFGTLPVLELADGTVISESLTIIEYLEELHPRPPLIGDTPLERARVRQLERIAETRVLNWIGRLVHAVRSPLGFPPDPAMERQAREALPNGLRHFEALLAETGPFLAGKNPTIADFTLQAAMQFARFREIEVLDGYERIAEWDRAYRERPAAKSVLLA